VVSSKRCRKASANEIKLYVSRNVLFRQFVAFCLVFAGVILSLLRLGHLAILVRSISAGDSSGVCVRTDD